jgi:hypothetical protein
MEIVPQTTKMLMADWDYFAKAINAVAGKTSEGFTPEQVYQAALRFDVNVFHVMDDDVKRGVLVLTDHFDIYTGESVLHVDMVYLTGPSIITGMTEILNIIASKYDFARVEFRSPRKGWFKYLNRAGFTAAATFSKEF